VAHRCGRWQGAVVGRIDLISRRPGAVSLPHGGLARSEFRLTVTRHKVSIDRRCDGVRLLLGVEMRFSTAVSITGVASMVRSARLWIARYRLRPVPR